jgi:hypothetical protein
VEHFATKAAARAGSAPGSTITTTTAGTPAPSEMMSPVDYERALAAGETA